MHSSTLRAVARTLSSSLAPACAWLALLACAPLLVAQSVVVPNANATARGTSQLNTLIRNAANARTYMHGIRAAELSTVPIGSVLTGVSFRFQVFGSNSASWPTSAITWSDYQIFVGPAVPLASWSGNFMTNFASPPVQVRSGPMTLPPNTYTNTSPPAPAANAWGEFYFDFQKPYLYLGGDLALLWSHPGSNDPTTAQYLDCVASSAATYGVAYTQSVYPVGSAGGVTTFCIPRLHYGEGLPCAGSGGRTPLLVLAANVTAPATTYVHVGNGPAGSPAAFLFGPVAIGSPLPGGCTLYTPPVVMVGATLSASGDRLLPLNVPFGVWGTVYIQSAVADAGAVAGFTTTNRAGLTVR